MEKVKIEYLHNNSLARIILDDGKGNVLDSVMTAELHELFESFKSQPDIKLITFEGAGKHFSFGASVPEHTKDKAGCMLTGFHQLFYDLIDLNIPTAAKISGQCLGGGMELALICNFLFAVRTANLGQPEVVLGVFPPPASILLPLKLGNARAEDLLITGKTINADEAKSIGLVNEVYESKDEMESAMNTWFETHFLPKSASSLRFANMAARLVFNTVLRNNLQVLERIYVEQLMNTDDANEGIAAFLEKRKPEWKNK
ncbi:MAG: Cyclohexa-1,5-dienecarbonyl-CoA hydratase [Ignavibacteria bacterium]|nr:Cyclohexa-1,5-dienecarbonyl-CoA hydratase [Ignavibacteria bacterium]